MKSKLKRFLKLGAKSGDSDSKDTTKSIIDKTMTTKSHDPLRELSEIRDQLSYSKRLGFLFGAGTSKSMGIPDIGQLTTMVEGNLEDELNVNFKKILDDLPPEYKHIEGVLNQSRLIRQVTSDSSTKSYNGIAGSDALLLDKAICDEIYKIIGDKEEKSKVDFAKKFISWLNWLPRDFPKEIFTTNYDLIIEKSAEELLIPFFDGFVGSNEPFFISENLDKKSKYNQLPISWIRLWKLHGSLGWFWKLNEDKSSSRVIRLSAGSKDKYPDAELVIYPSKEKYESSRKQPFTSYFDRLRDFLTEDEGIFIISGYSFSDDHVNEIIFNGLNQNNRLHIIAFFYSDESLKKIVDSNKNFPNITLIGPKSASISGTFGEWQFTKGGDLLNPYWDSDKEELCVGDFRKLVEFLILSTGRKSNKE